MKTSEDDFSTESEASHSCPEPKHHKDTESGNSSNSNQVVDKRQELYSGKYQSSPEKAPSLLAWLFDKIN